MKEKVFKAISQIMNTPVESITEASTYETIPNWDSLQHMNLVLTLEEEFGVKFSHSEILEMSGVQKILDVLKNKGLN